MTKTDPLNSLPEDYYPDAENLYDLFDVSPKTSTEEIEARYKEKMKEHHPDHSDDENAEDITFALNRAIDVVGDQNERLLYDQLGHHKYFNSTSRGNTVGRGVDETKDDVSLYDMIRMTNFEAHTDKNQRVLIQVVRSTGFKLTVLLGIVFLGLVFFLFTI